MALSNYVDASVQTDIAGLAKHPSIRPAPLSLSPRRDATTPPDDMLAEKIRLPPQSMPNMAPSHTSPTLLLRRKNRPAMVARISLPPIHYDDEAPNSPPPTETVMSPLPAANKLHAGHTPIIPQALSPLPLPGDKSTGPSTPEPLDELDEALTGPLTLPAQPTDGAADRIELKALDAELEKIAKSQKLADPDDSEDILARKAAENAGQPDPEKTVPEMAIPERVVSEKSATVPRRRSSTEDVEVVDGVILKKPKMNMGAPLGQA